MHASNEDLAQIEAHRASTHTVGCIERTDREKAEGEMAELEMAEREKAEHEKAEREKAERNEHAQARTSTHKHARACT